MGRVKEALAAQDYDAIATEGLDRFIKNKAGDKVENKTTSINLEKRHHEFILARGLNLSALVRDLIDKIMNAETEKLK